MEDLVRRTGLTTPQVEALATAGAFDGFVEGDADGMARRQALWTAGAVAAAGAALEVPLPSGRRPAARPAGVGAGGATGAGGGRDGPAGGGAAAAGGHDQPPSRMRAVLRVGRGAEPGAAAGQEPGAAAGGRVRTGRMAGLVTGAAPPPLPEMTEIELNRADLWATGVSPTSYPTEFLRADLERRGVVTAAGLVDVADGTRVTVGGIVTHRQRPATAQGTIFMNLEDETGLINVICSKGAWARYRRVARSEPALVIRGTVEKVEGVINLLAERIEPLRLAAATAGAPIRSRDFR